jgi:hypothetical protein
MSRRKKPQSFREWFEFDMDDEACRVMCKYGCCHAGIPGLIYYEETCAFYEAFKEEIWTLAVNNDTEELKILVQADGFAYPTNFENLMVWAAAERLASERLMRKGRA